MQKTLWAKIGLNRKSAERSKWHMWNHGIRYYRSSCGLHKQKHELAGEGENHDFVDRCKNCERALAR